MLLSKNKHQNLNIWQLRNQFAYFSRYCLINLKRFAYSQISSYLDPVSEQLNKGAFLNGTLKIIEIGIFVIADSNLDIQIKSIQRLFNMNQGVFTGIINIF